MKKTIKFLDGVIYWSIILLPFSIAIAPAFTYAFMGFLFSAFIIKKILKKEKLFRSTGINLPFLLLLIISLISFKNSIDLRASWQGITKLIQNALLFLICAEEIKDKKHIKIIILGMILGASLASFDGLWQVIFGKDFIRGHVPIINIGLKRATAAFPNANVFGVYLSAIAPLIIGIALFYLKGTKKIAMLFAAALATLGIILSFSRGTAIALYISTLFLSIARKKKVFSICLLIILLLFPFFMPKNIKEYAKQVDYNPALFLLNSDRVNIFRNSVNMVKHHPMVGVGVNTFSKNYLKYKLPEPDGRTGDYMYAHNNFLQMGGEIGLIGLGVFIWLLVRLFKQSAYIYKNLPDDELKIISLSLTACLISFLINGLTETSLYYSRVAMIFWYLIGFSLSLKNFIHAKNT